jgi:hypothetical protein
LRSFKGFGFGWKEVYAGTVGFTTTALPINAVFHWLDLCRDSYGLQEQEAIELSLEVAVDTNVNACISFVIKF